MGTVVNRALPSLHGGSLGISPTVPLSCKNLELRYCAVGEVRNDLFLKLERGQFPTKPGAAGKNIEVNLAVYSR